MILLLAALARAADAPLPAATPAAAGTTASTASSGEPFFSFAEKLYRSGDPYKALLEYERYLHFFPEGPRATEARLRTGWCYYAGRRYVQSLSSFRDLAATSERPQEKAEAWIGQGLCHLQMLAPRAARESFAQALAPGAAPPPRARLLLAWTFMEEFDWHNASQSLSSLLAVDPPERELVEELAAASAEASRLRRKNPALAMALSAAFPGGGQLYTGRVSDGVFTALVTDLFLGLTYLSLRRNDRTSAAILGSVAGLFYLGNLAGAFNSALIANERAPRAILERYRTRLLSPPDVPPVRE